MWQLHILNGLPEQKIEQIIMKNITVTYAKNPKSGVPAMSSGVEECTKKGIFARNIKELVLENVEIEGQDGELLVTEGIDHSCSRTERGKHMQLGIRLHDNQKSTT